MAYVDRTPWVAFSWLAAIALGYLTVRSLMDGLWHAALPILIATVLSLPPLRSLLASRLGLNLHGLFYAVPALALLGLGISLGAHQQTRLEKVAQQQAHDASKRKIAATREAAENEFRAAKLDILAEAQRMADAGNHDGVVVRLGKFRFTGDPDLVRIYDTSRLVILRKEVAQGGFGDERAVQLYSEIARLDPHDKQARVTADQILSRVAEERSRQTAKAQRQQQIEAHFSKWDGSHSAVESAIKAQMKNPDSYKHVETRYADNGADAYRVITTFRGTNSFNAVVTSTATATVSPSGQVLSLSIR